MRVCYICRKRPRLARKTVRKAKRSPMWCIRAFLADGACLTCINAYHRYAGGIPTAEQAKALRRCPKLGITQWVVVRALAFARKGGRRWKT
jgi:hypothetical protein